MLSTIILSSLLSIHPWNFLVHFIPYSNLVYWMIRLIQWNWWDSIGRTHVVVHANSFYLRTHTHYSITWMWPPSRHLNCGGTIRNCVTYSISKLYWAQQSGENETNRYTFVLNTCPSNRMLQSKWIYQQTLHSCLQLKENMTILLLNKL